LVLISKTTNHKTLSYKKLHVWQLSLKCAIDIHKMSLGLPSFEYYETGSQIRRSSKSVKSNIVEGYGRRKYLKDYIKFLIYAQASNDETIDHLETLFLTGSLSDKETYHKIQYSLILLGKKLNRFIQTLQQESYK
jgi:four helix bundle protein